MIHIETIELASSAASITFSSIPQDYTDLMIKVSARTDHTAVDDDAIISFNSNTSNFSIVRLFGTGSSATSLTVPARFVGFTNANEASSNTYSSQSIYISNYTASAAKSYSVDSVTENNGTQSFQDIAAGLWDNTASITSASFTSANGGNFLTGSIFSLYGITKGSDGTTTVS